MYQAVDLNKMVAEMVTQKMQPTTVVLAFQGKTIAVTVEELFTPPKTPTLRVVFSNGDSNEDYIIND